MYDQSLEWQSKSGSHENRTLEVTKNYSNTSNLIWIVRPCHKNNRTLKVTKIKNKTLIELDKVFYFSLFSEVSLLKQAKCMIQLLQENRTLEVKNKEFYVKLTKIYHVFPFFCTSVSKTSRSIVYDPTLTWKSNCRS